MTTIFIIHGSNGTPEGHWRGWLKKQLESKNCTIIAPQFPIREAQHYSDWLRVLEPYKEQLNDAILIGHSLGVPFILNVLNTWECSARASFLVAGFARRLVAKGESNLDEFSNKEFDWERIKKNCKSFQVFHSDNDPYVPLELGEELAAHLETKLNLVKGGAHFQSQSGYETFPLLLEMIEKEL